MKTRVECIFNRTCPLHSATNSSPALVRPNRRRQSEIASMSPRRLGALNTTRSSAVGTPACIAPCILAKECFRRPSNHSSTVAFIISI